MKLEKTLDLIWQAAQESVEFLESLQHEEEIPSEIKQRLKTQIELFKGLSEIKSSGIAAPWMHLIKAENATTISFSLGQLSAMICAALPAYEIEKAKNVLLATDVLSFALRTASTAEY
ncbi:MAG: hypothetical protein ACOYMZ_03635 [Minisyncoccia bacterium]